MTQNRLFIILAIVLLAAVVVVAVVIHEPDEEPPGAADGADIDRPQATQRDGLPRIRAPRPGGLLDGTRSPARPDVLPTPKLLGGGPNRALRDAVFGADLAKREQALLNLSRLLAKGEGKDILAEMLDSNDPDLVSDAQSLIPNLDEGERMPFLRQGLRSPFAEARVESLMLLRDVATQDVNGILILALKDTDPNVLEEAADLFVYFMDQPIYRAAMEALQHADPEIRESGLSYLEDTHTSRAVMALIECLSNRFPEIPPAAGDALRFITDAEIDSNDYDDWRSWWDAYGKAWAAEFSDDDEEQEFLDMLEEFMDASADQDDDAI